MLVVHLLKCSPEPVRHSLEGLKMIAQNAFPLAGQKAGIVDTCPVHFCMRLGAKSPERKNQNYMRVACLNQTEEDPT